MSLDYKKIELSDKIIFDEYYKNEPQNSGYTSFVTLYAWRNNVNYKFAYKNGEIFLKFHHKTKNKSYFFMPQHSEESIKKAVETIILENEIPSFYNITETQMKTLEKLYGDLYAFERNRNGDNYIYTSESLINLSGKKLHSKKNKLNKFKKTYDYRYIVPDEQKIMECIDISRKWCERKCNESEADLTACEEVLSNIKELGVKCGAIECDGKIIAFSIGEKINNDMAIIHFEKADTDYDGSFSTINNEFVLNEWKDIKYINREEDMGIEGLRKAKLAYCPSFMLETYIAEYNE